jgi:hypothetical protein
MKINHLATLIATTIIRRINQIGRWRKKVMSLHFSSWKNSILKVTPKPVPKRRKKRGTVWPGVDVMFAIFVNFRRKKAFFLKTNDMITLLQKLVVVLAKSADVFAKFFVENIFKIITSAPAHFSQLFG